MSSVTPMDVYSSTFEIDFNTAAYCRGHKYSPEAVKLAQAIRQKKAAEDLVRNAENVLHEKREALSNALQAVQEKMKRDPA